MKILILFIIVLVCVLIVLLIAGLLIKKEYSIVREVYIKKPKATVFDFIKLLKNQNDFSVWATIDPNMKKEFTGTDGTAGFISSWESDNKNVGKGEQEILKVVDNEKVDYEIRFIRPFESTSYATMSVYFITENQTKVQWIFNGKMKYPMNLMLLFMNMEKMIGKDLEKGLLNLKSLLEK